ncbi:MAG: S9 family peptidase, partial [Bdellovibrionales bacterium]|nr:S9 family peptidase [Bdellovibrionales bacterium]
DYYYFSKFQKGEEYPIYLRKPVAKPKKEEVLLNLNAEAKGHDFFNVNALAVSFDHNTLAYAVDTVGRRFYDLHFKTIGGGKKISDVIKATTGNIAWLNDNKTILYTKQDPETLRSYQLYKYTLGGKSELIYEEKDPQFYISISKSLTLNEIHLNIASTTSSEVRIADANAPNDLKFKIFLKREKKHEYSVDDGGDRYYILSNYKAQNFRLFETNKDQTEKRYWREVVPHRSHVLLENILVLKSHIVLEEREDGLTQLSYFKRGQKKRTRLSFPDPTYVAGIGTNAEYETDFFRYDYQSMTRPETIFDYDFATLKSKTVKVEEVPTYNSSEYTSERLFAKATDGTKIPISLVYKKSLFKKSKNPLYIYAYGSYGHSTDTYFRSGIISLLDRGFVFAIAHVRGGSEMGRHWYENGKLLKKKNTFTDFIDCTEALIKKGYGKKDHVYAMGGSAGGLLMGSILNMRPDLYRGVVAAVPFVDVVTTMLDDTIPLTTNEYEEWGNPNVKKYYQYIKSYSPYDNIKKQNYPNLLITTGFHDSQVQYWEPAKWIAKLRENNTGSNLLLMKTDMSAGHSGATGRFKSLIEDALDYAFFLMLEGIDK